MSTHISSLRFIAMNASLRILAVTILLSAPSISQVPRSISYQGVLADAAGTFIADGNHLLTLRLYDNAAASTPLYTEVQTVAVVRGLFNVIIGSATPIPADLRFDRAYFLGVTVGAGSELQPRTPLTSVPYALRAAVADVAASVAPTAAGIVTAMNGRSGALTLQGGGGTTVTGSGNTITISSVGGGGTGIQGVQSTDGSIAVANPNGPIATLGIADGGVQSRHITDGSISAADIAPGVIPNPASFLAAGSAAGGDLAGTYPNPRLAAGAVTAAAIADGAVTGSKLATGAAVRSINTLSDNVTLAAGANVSITPSGNTLTIAATGGGGAAGIQSLNSTNQTIDISNPNGPATTINVAANSIKTAHLGDGAVTAPKLAPGLLPASLPPSGAAGGDLTGAYPNPSIAANAVATAEIADGAVTLPKLSTSGATSGQTITFNGSSVIWQDPAGVGGTGVQNRIALWNGTNTLSSDAGFTLTPGSTAKVALGFQCSATGNNGVAIGAQCSASGNNTVAIGAGSSATQNGAVAIGVSAAATGVRSFALGNFVTAANGGSFVLGDNNTTTLTSSASNQMNMKFTGGYRLFSNSAFSTGVTMAAGVSGWTNVCDRNLKEHFTDVDGERVLASFRVMPISEWSYRGADPSIRYMGPMAQDFHRAFKLGGSDSLGINSIIADGVSMAAIQALEKRTAELRAELEKRTDEVAALRERVNALARLFAAQRTAPANSSTPEPASDAEGASIHTNSRAVKTELHGVPAAAPVPEP